MYLLVNGTIIINVGGIMIKKALIGTFLLVFGILMSGLAYAGSSSFGSSTSSQFDVSIDRVSLNNQVVSQSKNRLRHRTSRLNGAEVIMRNVSRGACPIA